jgi:Zn-dependent protease
MIGHIAETQFDLRFRVGPIPVRVHPIFWITGLIIVWSPYQSDPPMLLIAVLSVFVSVLVHELGHATVTRLFGWPSEIVLGFFGGYATTARTSTARNLLVLFAGPGAGFLLAGVSFVGLLLLVGVEGVNRVIQLFMRGELEREVETLGFLLYINIAWSVLNLVPVLPLDGGQIVREVLVWLSPGRGEERAMLLSAVVGAVAAAGGYLWLHHTFLAILFGMFAYQNFAAWQMRRRGGWS